MKLFSILFLSFILLFTNVNAQQNKGKISAKVIDAITKAPVEYAAISVLKQGSTSAINGGTSDTKGNFTIIGLPYGEYQLLIDFIGYKHSVIDHVVISAAKGTVILNTVLLTPTQNQLKDINITSQKSTIENKIDKLVYNVGNDITSQGGVATDILKKVPMVTVDIDGNVELLGNPSVKFLINGKPSSIFGASLADALQSIPSSQIKSIEVITSPGAKYDATGTGGIINIILKDNSVQGYNGSINLSAGTRLENGSINLNARTNKLGINAYFSGNETLRSKNLGSRTRINKSGDTTQNQFQSITGYTGRQGYQSGMGLDWNPTKKDNLSVSFSYHHFTSNNDIVTNQEDQQLKGAVPFSDISSVRNSNGSSGEYAFDANVGYKKTFKKEGQELDVQYNTSFNRSNSVYYQKQDYTVGNSSGSQGNNPGHDHQQEIAIDYTHPVNDYVTLETGAKAGIENISTASNVNNFNPTLSAFVFDPVQSVGFTYGRNVFAYYASASFKLFNFFNVKAGLRDEYTSTSVDFAGASIPDYNFLSPSFVLSHKISKTQTIKIAYSKRIERPDFGDLNPFVNYSDPYNISYGNPNLHPEIGNNFELNYNSSFSDGANINITAFFRHNGFDVKQYTFRQDSLLEPGGKYYNVYSQTRANVGAEITSGLNLSSSIPLTSKLTIRSNISLMQRRVLVNLPNTPPFVMGYELRMNANAAYQFSQDIAAEGFVNYQTPRVNLQGTNSSFASYNFAVKKLFWNKMASIGLTANVPFNEYVNQTSTITQTTPKYSYQYSLRQVPFRSFGILLSYRFGKLEFKKDKDEQQPSLPDQGN